MVLNPLAQEISSNLCDVGHDPQELESEIEQFIVVGGMHVQKDTIDKSLVEPGWNSKVRQFFFYIQTALTYSAQEWRLCSKSLRR